MNDRKSKVIRVSAEVYEQLEVVVSEEPKLSGFSNPSQVIQFLLDYYFTNEVNTNIRRT